MKSFRKMMVFVVIISIVLTLFALVSAAPLPPYTGFDATSDAGIVPFYTEGNDNALSFTGLTKFSPTFEFGTSGVPKTGTHEFVIDAAKGQKLIITLATDSNLGGAQFISKWEAVNIEIYYFIVKGGDGFLTYVYDGSLLTDGRLFPPLNNGGEHPIISHISIYYKPTTTESSSSVTTTTTSQATTTTTTTEATTTTTASEATTSTTTPSEATVTNPTTTLMTFTTDSIPLVSVTTVTTTAPLTTLTNPNVPQTGEGDSGNGLLIGLILLALAGALTVVVYRSKSVKA